MVSKLLRVNKLALILRQQLLLLVLGRINWLEILLFMSFWVVQLFQKPCIKFSHIRKIRRFYFFESKEEPRIWDQKLFLISSSKFYSNPLPRLHFRASSLGMYKNMNRNLLRRITFDLIRHVAARTGPVDLLLLLFRFISLARCCLMWPCFRDR